MGRFRPMVSALLSVVQPGLGHAYLRSWGRAVLWFATWVATVAVVATVPAPGAGVDVVGYLASIVAALNEVGLAGSLALAAVTVFATMDAYWLGVRARQRRTTGTRCPSCGKEVDPSLGFCHWCTAELEGGRRTDQGGDASE